MKYIFRFIKEIWEAAFNYYYGGVIELIHKIKTGEDKFYSEIKEEKLKRKLNK